VYPIAWANSNEMIVAVGGEVTTARADFLWELVRLGAIRCGCGRCEGRS
jgi:hypothetical protein